MIPNDFQMEVDPDLFKQIVLNLITNAMAYTPVEGKILLKVQEISQGWKMIVSDTGIGIPEDDLGRIFERFYRVDKARSRNSGGTGLGLAIVKHLVEEHQGEIDVSSIVGTGTTFTLTFPLQQRD
jgi:two-component system phosphate regulon sensor histidine kinase PhoR